MEIPEHIRKQRNVYSTLYLHYTENRRFEIIEFK